MFLNLQHKTLHAYTAVRELVKDVYKISKLLPADEKFNMVSQMRRAALFVKLNLAEGSTRHSEQERKRYAEIARGSVVEIDAVPETAVDVNYFKPDQLAEIRESLNKCFAYAVENDRITRDAICRLTFAVSRILNLCTIRYLIF